MSKLFDSEGAKLIELMGDKYVTRIPCKLPMWKVAGNEWRKEYRQKKLTLFSTICTDFSDLFLVYDDKPTEWGINGDWKSVSQNTWRIPSNIDIKQLYNWLNPGLWTIYNAIKPVSLPVYAGPNLEHWVPVMESESIQILVSASFDSEPWHIIFNPYAK